MHAATPAARHAEMRPASRPAELPPGECQTAPRQYLSCQQSAVRVAVIQVKGRFMSQPAKSTVCRPNGLLQSPRTSTLSCHTSQQDR